jgi:hypothetical protein
MNDHFDTLITESLHRDAAALTGRGAGFGDVRRRARRRQQRNVAAMTVPAVLGVAALAMRPSPQPAGVQPGGAGSSGPATTVENTTAFSSPTSTTVAVSVVTPTTIELPSGPGQVACVNASGVPTYSAVALCMSNFGNSVSFKAGRASEVSFVMALDTTDPALAAGVAKTLGLPLRTLDTTYLPVDVDLAATGARVIVVLGQATSPYTTTPGATTVPPTTSYSG